MTIRHAKTSGIPNPSDATLVGGADWDEDHVGSGLPSQWTDGGNGDVTAATDDPAKTPITVKATAEQQLAATPLIAVVDDQGQVVWYVRIENDNEGALQNFTMPGGTTRHKATLDDNDEDADASYNIYAGDGIIFSEVYQDKVDPESSYAQIVVHEPPQQTEVAINVRRSGGSRRFAVLAEGSPVIAQIAAPADDDLNASELALWFDDTNGAAKLRIKGKSANGTVVTGSVNLT